jgi:hypothetical protein
MVIRNCRPINALTVQKTRRLIESFGYCYHSYTFILAQSDSIKRLTLYKGKMLQRYPPKIEQFLFLSSTFTSNASLNPLSTRYSSQVNLHFFVIKRQIYKNTFKLGYNEQLRTCHFCSLYRGFDITGLICVLKWPIWRKYLFFIIECS